MSKVTFLCDEAASLARTCRASTTRSTRAGYGIGLIIDVSGPAPLHRASPKMAVKRCWRT